MFHGIRHTLRHEQFRESKQVNFIYKALRTIETRHTSQRTNAHCSKEVTLTLPRRLHKPDSRATDMTSGRVHTKHKTCRMAHPGWLVFRILAWYALTSQRISIKSAWHYSSRNLLTNDRSRMNMSERIRMARCKMVFLGSVCQYRATNTPTYLPVIPFVYISYMSFPVCHNKQHTPGTIPTPASKGNCRHGVCWLSLVPGTRN